MKAIRAFAAASTLLIAALTAHILAGGDPLSLHSALSLTFLSFVIAAFLIRKSGDPIRVTLAIFFAQNAGHFIVGSQGHSDSQMLLAHASAGMLSYHLLRYFDRNLPDLGRAFISLITRALPRKKFEISLPTLLAFFRYRGSSAQYFSTALSLRGPPLH
jgi:hypothetical protein